MVGHSEVHVADGVEILNRIGADRRVIYPYPVVVFVKGKNYAVGATLIFLAPNDKAECAVLLLEEEMVDGVGLVTDAV